METHSKFNLQELVIYRNQLYIVESIHAINWFCSNPIVYGLVRLGAKPSKYQRNNQLMVREPLISKAPKGSHGKEKRRKKTTSI